VIYADGRSVPKDDETAVKWYNLAPKQNYTVAQSNLGVMNENGEGVRKDYRTAVKWYSLAAKQRDAFAQSYLRRMKFRFVSLEIDKCILNTICKFTKTENKGLTKNTANGILTIKP
tara:strand:- start:452 stop:799 length:348 start_codon:yes stop_codon:yes gene_type:complete